jgi:hypothetical protein
MGRKPGAGNPLVRFDESRLETGRKLPRQSAALLYNSFVTLILESSFGLVRAASGIIWNRNKNL